MPKNRRRVKPALAVVAVALLGAGCVIASPDLVDTTFRCSDSAGCPEGQSCLDQVCTREVANVCADSNECRDGEDCQFGYCTPSAGFLRCGEEIACPEGLGCFDGICLPPPAQPSPAVWGDVLVQTFDGEIGGIVRAIDRTGNGREPFRLARVNFVEGAYGPGIQSYPGSVFDGMPVIQYADRPAFSLGNVFTVELWAKIDVLGDGTGIIGDRVDGGETPPTFQIDVDGAGNLHFFTNDGCNTLGEVELVQTMGTPLSEDTFHHIAYTWDSETVVLYIDGVSTQSYPLSAVPCDHDAPLRIGSETGNPVLRAVLDEIKLSSEAKSADDIIASRDQSPAQLIEQCGDRILRPAEACDSQMCCDPATCELRPDGTPCGGLGTCDAGSCRIDGGRVGEEALLYLFDEGQGATVRDSLGRGPELAILDPDNVSWTSDGLRIDEPTLLESVEPPAAMHVDCLSSNELTVELWVSPANIEQGGPARIFTYSGSNNDVNFMVGQSVRSLSGRVRTSATEDSGLPDLDPEPDLLSTSPTHIVLTSTPDGRRYLYLDGRRVYFNEATGDLSSWNASHVLRLANERDAEGTPARPWLGTLHMAAVYCRALSSTEVARNFTAGSP